MSDGIELEYSERLLSHILNNQTHLSAHASLPHTADAYHNVLGPIAAKFNLSRSTAQGRGFADPGLHIINAEKSCRSALLVREQLLGDVPAETQCRDTELRQKQQQHLTRCLGNPYSECLGEAKLEQSLLQGPPVCLQGFSYLHLREWKSSCAGVGDLVFTDGRGLFAVIELKYINEQNKNNKTNKRRKVKKQAKRYGKAFMTDHPEAAVVIAGTFTEERQGVFWIDLEGQEVDKVRMLAQLAAKVTTTPRNEQRTPAIVSPAQTARPFAAETVVQQRPIQSWGSWILGIGVIGAVSAVAGVLAFQHARPPVQRRRAVQ